MEAGPFIPLYWLMPRKAWVSDFEVERRGSQHCDSCWNGGCSGSARKRPPARHYRNCRRAKATMACSQFLYIKRLSPSGILAAYALIVFSALRHGNRPLYPPGTGSCPIRHKYLTVRVERRGSQHLRWITNGGCSGSARKRPPACRCSSCRRAKATMAYSQILYIKRLSPSGILAAYALIVFSALRHGNRPLYPPGTGSCPIRHKYLTVRVERRGSQHSIQKGNGGCSGSARKRPPAW